MTFRGPDNIEKALLAMREALSFVLEPETSRLSDALRVVWPRLGFSRTVHSSGLRLDDGARHRKEVSIAEAGRPELFHVDKTSTLGHPNEQGGRKGGRPPGGGNARSQVDPPRRSGQRGD